MRATVTLVIVAIAIVFTTNLGGANTSQLSARQRANMACLNNLHSGCKLK